MNVAELERELGSPDKFIPTADNWNFLCDWAVAKGLRQYPVTAGTVELANLYHEHAGQIKPSDAQKLAAEITMTVIQALGTALDERRVREIIAETQPVTRIEISTPTETVQIDGPVHYLTERVIRIAALAHPIMLVGPAGCGKTTIGEHVAKALGLDFRITSTINDTHELTGFMDGHGVYHRTPFRDAFEHGGVWIADEIDAWDASALLAANSALANGVCVFPDSPIPMHRHADFRMIATANTFGSGADRVYVGRNELDAASLDRFATLDVDYDLTLERMLAGGPTRWLNHVWDTRKRVTEKRIRHVVSTRAIIMGTAALAAGIDWDCVCNIYLLKGMSEADRRKIS